MEVWKNIEDFDGRYQISSCGRVKSLCRQKEQILKPGVSVGGYLIVRLSRPGELALTKQVHRLVAQAFLCRSPHQTQVNHKDGNRQNNNVDNLEWVTPKENVAHSINVLGRKSPMLNKKGKDNKNSVPVCQYDLNGNFVKEWFSVSDAARALNCNPCQIINVISGRLITCHGFIWSYEKSDKIDNSRVRNKKTHKNI